MSGYGHPTFRPHTPNLDRLAERGVRFAEHFCNSTVCVSSRICTLTGRHPEETGVYNNEASWPNYRLPVPLETFPPVLAWVGYRTANFGKIHVPDDLAGQAGRSIRQVHDPAERVNLAGRPEWAEVVADLSNRLDRHGEGAVEVPAERLAR